MRTHSKWLARQSQRKQAFEEDGKWFLNWYHCIPCDVDWTDDWSCKVDDECPCCGREFSPTHSSEINFIE